MHTECTPALFEFEPVERRKVVAGFDGGIITSDAGGLLLGQLDRGLGLIRRMAACFTDRRDPRLLEHRVETLVGQRVFGLTAYNTQNIKSMYVESDGAAVVTKKAIMGALRLYLNFINMFQFILALMSGGDD